MSETIETNGTQAEDTALQPGQNAPDTGQVQTETVETSKSNPPDTESPEGNVKREADEAIAKEAFKAREARRQAKAAQDKLDAYERANPPAPDSPEARQAEVNKAAEEMVKAQAFNAKCDDIYAAGTKEFPDFQRAISAFQQIGGLPTSLIEACDEAGDAHKLLHYLGSHPDEAEALVGLSPSRMGAAVAKLAAKAAAPPPPPPVSKAPPPVTTVRGSTIPEPDPEKMTPEQYHAWRMAKRRSG